MRHERRGRRERRGGRLAARHRSLVALTVSGRDDYRSVGHTAAALTLWAEGVGFRAVKSHHAVSNLSWLDPG